MSSRGARITYPIHSDEDVAKAVNTATISTSDHLILIPKIRRGEVTYDYIGNHQ